MRSLPIDFNNGTITQAKMTVTQTGAGNISLFLSADGGTNFEAVASGTLHLFSNTGTSLIWRIEASGKVITQIVVEDYH